MKQMTMIGLLVLALLLAACGGEATPPPGEGGLPVITLLPPDDTGGSSDISAPNPLQPVQVGELPATIGAVSEHFDFAQPGTFEELVEGDSGLYIRNGHYDIQVAGGVWWGQGGTEHADAAVEVDVLAVDLAVPRQALWGVMCRADPANTGDGYAFTVGPDNEFAIMRGEGDGYTDLATGTTTQLTGGVNTLRAVCVGSYLAFYINGQFVAAVEDATYASGVPALLAGGAPNNVITATFDNLTVYSASLAQ